MKSDMLVHDVMACKRKAHKFKLVGSDKTPLRRSLVCETCTTATGKQVYVAFPVEEKSSGEWRSTRRREHKIEPEIEADL